jgi:outer membrane protein
LVAGAAGKAGASHRKDVERMRRMNLGSERALLVALLAALTWGCQQEKTNPDASITAYRDRMLVRHQQDADAEPDATPALVTRPPREPVARPVAQQSKLPDRRSLLTGPAITTQPAPADVLSEVPDPAHARDAFQRRLERLREEQRGRQDQRVVRSYERVITEAERYLAKLDRPRQFELSLSECVQRALEHNYTIRSEAHNPAISETQIVEAEAAFDAEFYLDFGWNDSDPAVDPDSLTSSQSEGSSIEGGFRKLLPTGMQASVALRHARTRLHLNQNTPGVMNPTHNAAFIASLRQPLLRGFGLDVNRAQIELRKTEYGLSYEQFVQQVRDTLVEVESAYWQLVQARRAAVIIAETVAQNYVTYQNMLERLEHDATQVEVANSRSRWQVQEVNYLERVRNVKDAEDRLKNLINDPDLLLSEDIEIVPTATPVVAPILLDQFGEVRTALDRRTELRQARQQIEAARISTNVAKNQVLPQLDVTFQYEVEGMRDTIDDAFDNLTTNRFISYTLGVSFSYNIGERAARAAYRRARLQESQAIVAINQIADAIVEDVNTRIRTLNVRYEQIPPSLDSAIAAERNLRSLQARTQSINPNYLQTELTAVESLSSNRQTLLGVLIEYNVGLIQLERAKGTLLDYNNVVVADVRSAR